MTDFNPFLCWALSPPRYHPKYKCETGGCPWLGEIPYVGAWFCRSCIEEHFKDIDVEDLG